MIRDQGLALLTPLSEGVEADAAERALTRRFPEVPLRLATGLPVQSVADSLPGFARPESVPVDPLALIQAERLVRAERRRQMQARAEAVRQQKEEPVG